MKQPNLVKLAESYVTANGATRSWRVGQVDPLLKWVAPPTNSPETIAEWKPASSSRLGLDLEKSRLIAVTFERKDDRLRLEEQLGYSLSKSRMSDETCLLRLPGASAEFPTFARVAPGTFLQSAYDPLVIPESALEWLDDPRNLARIAIAQPSLLDRVHPAQWTRDRWRKIL